MATYNKYECFVEDLANKLHDLFGTTPGSDCDVLKIMLSNTAPNLATHEVRADATEIAAGNGYTSGGAVIPNQLGARTGGTFTLSGDSVVFTSSGAFSAFQYVILYNDTQTAPADPLISEWNHGSAVNLASGETYTINFNNDPTAGTIFTLT